MSRCLQHCGNERKALDPVPKEGEATLNTVVSRDWCRWKDKRGAKWRTKSKVVPFFSALLGQMELKVMDEKGQEIKEESSGKARPE